MLNIWFLSECICKSKKILQKEIKYFFLLFQNEAAKKKGSKTKEGKPNIRHDDYLIIYSSQDRNLNKIFLIKSFQINSANIR